MAKPKFLSLDGVQTLVQYFKDRLSEKVDIESGKTLSDNNFSDEEKTKLAGIEADSQVNLIESISVNGNNQSITNKNVDIAVPLVDNTLTQAGQSADAKATGDAISELTQSTANDVANLQQSISSTATTIRGEIADEVSIINQTISDVENAIPTNVSELTNDSNYATTSQLTTQITNVRNDIPTNVSELVNDSDYTTKLYVDGEIARVEGDIPINISQLNNDNNYTTKSYVDDEIDAVEAAIPTNVSQLTNDVKYQTENEVARSIANSVSQITSFDYQILNELPQTGKKGTIYLVLHTHGGEDKFDEYIWVNNRYEKLGNTDIDLSGYARTTDLPTKVSDLNNDSNFTTKTYVDGKLDTKQDVIDYGTPTSADIGKALMPKVISNGEVTEWEFGESGSIDDVQVNGTSIVSDGVANIPYASADTPGLIKTSPQYGLSVNSNTGLIGIAPPSFGQIKSGDQPYAPISSLHQHASTFYGLAKAAGDTTQSQSSNAVGTYTDEAKTAIKSMLGISEPTDNVVIIEGEWTNPQPNTHTVDYADETMSNEKLIEMIEDSIENHTNTIFVLALDFAATLEDTVQKRYFYFQEKFTDAKLGGDVYSFFSSTAVSNDSVDFGKNLYLIKLASGIEYSIMWMEDDLKFDIQIDSTSIVNTNRIANIDSASTAFNGLAKAAGDTTQAQSGNTVGTYTDEAKTAIQTMLGVDDKLDAPATAGTSGQVLTSDGNGGQTWEDPSGGTVTDVQINGTSIVSSGVANVPVASDSTLGVAKTGTGAYGVYLSNGEIRVAKAISSHIKSGNQDYRAITPTNQHESTFYGLAKVAGVDMANSSNAVGTYTPEAKSAIQSMLGVPASDIIAPQFDSTLNYSEGDYVINEGKLYKFTASHSTGALDGSDTTEVILSEEFSGNITDVELDGTSILNNGVANIPMGAVGQLGVVQATAGAGGGIAINPTGGLIISKASSSDIKGGAGNYRPIVTSTQHEATFYGLAKAAGDSTQSSSNNAVGTYTDSAKSAIQTMLGIDDINFSDRIGNGTGTKALVTGDIGTNDASGNFSIANGADSIASGVFSFAEGRYSIATGNGSHAEGSYSHEAIILNGEAGSLTYTYNASLNSYLVSVLQNGFIIVRQDINHFDPNDYVKLVSIDNDTHTITVDKTLSADSDIIDQTYYLIHTTYASGISSHAEGFGASATNAGSHSEGGCTLSLNIASHSEGYYTKASGQYSHSAGIYTNATGLASHAGGAQTTASGICSVSFGQDTTAQGLCSYSEGDHTVATHKSQHVFGDYNVFESISSEHPVTQRGSYVEIVGNGDSTARSNARTLDWSGNEWLAGTLKIGGTSYADATEVATKADISDYVTKESIDNAGITATTYTVVMDDTITTSENADFSYPYTLYNNAVSLNPRYKYRITFNGVEYIVKVCTWYKRQDDSMIGYSFIGNGALYDSELSKLIYDYFDLPFCLVDSDHELNGNLQILTPETGTYTIKIERVNYTKRKIIDTLIYGDEQSPINKKYYNNSSYVSISIGENLLDQRGTMAIGIGNKVSGEFSQAHGIHNTATGAFAFAENGYNTASGNYSHAEGAHCNATGTGSHASGYYTTASGGYSHSENFRTISSGSYSHAEGGINEASGFCAHVEGTNNIASGAASHAEGTITIANSMNQHVFGSCNIADNGSEFNKGTYIEIVGNGSDENNRSNARTLDWSGNEWLAGTLKIGGTSYANANEVATQSYVTSAIAAIDTITASQIDALFT